MDLFGLTLGEAVEGEGSTGGRLSFTGVGFKSYLLEEGCFEGVNAGGNLFLLLTGVASGDINGKHPSESPEKTKSSKPISSHTSK